MSLDSAILTAAASLRAQGTVLGVTADNIANLNTPGFKRGEATLVSGVSQIPQVFLRRDMSQGAIAPTGNPNDLAINGNGFFEVQLPGGQSAFTRSGAFGLSSGATMVDVTGNPVVGPIQTDPAGGPIMVSSSGQVSQTVNGTSRVLGQLNLATFPNPGGLSPQNGNLFSAAAASGQPSVGTGGQIIQGAIETPNVDLAQELITMITARVVYEASARVITTANNMEKRLLAIV
ncbi:MAG: flagellar hook basal-body protein [Proteobacteria bacterium]|nr:flagellar hook basal-body protein [Pseudomonadota bacterium]